MMVSRMDLDGNGAGSPEGLVRLILKSLPDLRLPVAIEELCYALDISEIQPLASDGYEGGLITDPERSSGIVLVNKNVSVRRQRFTIAHELGHFLIPTHMPNLEGRFLCSREDMRALGGKEGNRRARMEGEANRFASLILIPPPILRREFMSMTEVGLNQVFELAETFCVSKEAMARTFCDHHPGIFGIVLVHENKVLRHYHHRHFPYMSVSRGQPVPIGSSLSAIRKGTAKEGVYVECEADNWFDTKRGTKAPVVFEQAVLQRDGYAMIMLQVEEPDEDDEDEPDLQEQWKIGFHR